MKKILIVLTTALLLAACSNDNDPAAINDGRRVPLQVTGYIAYIPLGITRAAGSAWEAGDQIGLYALPHGTTTEPIDDGSNVCYSTPSEGETSGTLYLPFTTATPITLPSTGNIDVYGYYPYSDKTTDPTAIAVNVETETEKKIIDLMTTGKVEYTKQDNTKIPINSANPECQLLFHHRLTKLVFNLDLSEMGTIGTIALTVGSQKAATYDMYHDELTCTGDANKTISAVALATPNPNYNKTFEAIVLPNNATDPITITGNPAADRTVSIVVDGRSYTFTIAASGDESSTKVKTPSFTSGKKYVYNVKVYPFTIEVNPQNYTEQW